MSYQFVPRNKNIEDFHIGSLAWQMLFCNYFGTLFPIVDIDYFSLDTNDFYFYLKNDDRLKNALPTDNDGFFVTNNEAKIIARMTCNLVNLAKEARKDGLDIFPEYVYRNMNKYERLAQFCKESKGFKII